MLSASASGGTIADLVGRLDEAEDLTQEVFLRIYRARKGYRPAGEVFDLALHDCQ